MYSPALVSGPLHQGEILSDVVELRVEAAAVTSETEEVDVSEKIHPMAIVLTQACDLEWDFQFRSIPVDNKDKLGKPAHKELSNVLLCEVWKAMELKGSHDLNRSLWKPIQKNKDERYHFLRRPTPQQDALETGFEDDLAIDFKRIFTIGTENLYSQLEQKARRRCFLQGPFMQHLSVGLGTINSAWRFQKYQLIL